MSQVNTGVRASVATGATTRLRAIGWGLASIVVAIAVGIYGAYGDPHPKTSQENAVPFVAVVVAVLAVALFGLLVPMGLRGMAARTRRWSGTALALGIVGSCTGADGFVEWAAGGDRYGGGVVGHRGSRRGERRRPCTGHVVGRARRGGRGRQRRVHDPGEHAAGRLARRRDARTIGRQCTASRHQ